MDTHQLTISYAEVQDAASLPEADRDLLGKAWQACESAYSPYSKFKVGVALRLSNDIIFLGNNQENAAYPSGLCAERVAIFSASANQPGVPIQSLAVVAKTDIFLLSDPVTPCGSCRQVMAEYEMLSGKPVRILLQGSKGGRIWIIEGIQNLLPLMFHGNELKK